MTTAQHQRAKDIFLQACDLGPERRAAFLESACGSDADLRATVERMLAHDDDPAGLERLEAAGLRQYEISNVARNGYKCRHNVKYWQSGDWWGFGCGAHTTVAGRRWRNVSGTEEFVARMNSGRSVTEGLVHLTPDERFAEAMFTGLRLTEGVDGGEQLVMTNWCRSPGYSEWPCSLDSYKAYRVSGSHRCWRSM